MRSQSRSLSESPKRYIRDKSLSPLTQQRSTNRYELSSPPRKYRSPSPSPRSSRYISPPPINVSTIMSSSMASSSSRRSPPSGRLDLNSIGGGGSGSILNRSNSRQTREQSPVRYGKLSPVPGRHRSDKHSKHKHKY